jgi:hypothetical protein
MSKSREYAIVHAMPTQSPETPPDQLQKFQDLARELEADESEERFEETVRRIAPKSPPPAPKSED